MHKIPIPPRAEIHKARAHATNDVGYDFRGQFIVGTVGGRGENEEKRRLATFGDPDGLKKWKGKEGKVIHEVARGQSGREMMSDLIGIGDHEEVALESSSEEWDSGR
jgi:hypothetical protein